MNKKGFTLAEVLITLGIIGVVAALTLPSVIGNYQKQTYVAGAKKAYSTLSNMLSKIAADDGVGGFAESYLFSDVLCTPDWRNGGVANGCEDNYGNPSKFEEIIPKYLNVVKMCKGQDCDIEYILGLQINNHKFDYSYKITGTIEDSYGAFHKPIYGFYTADGMIYYFTVGDGAIFAAVDVNGEKQPNTYGRDLFHMFACKNGRIVDGDSPNDQCSAIDNKDIYGRSLDVFPLNYLMSNGWKMDY